jgi:chitodextrinase
MLSMRLEKPEMPLSTKTRVEITGLTPDKTYWFQVRANGTQGSSEWPPAVLVCAIAP